MLIGYARTSTTEQEAGLQAQLRDLKEAGCEEVYSEQIFSVDVRAQLRKARIFTRKGDTLVVTKVDRLARSTVGLWEIVKELDEKGRRCGSSIWAVRRWTPRAPPGGSS